MALWNALADHGEGFVGTVEALCEPNRSVRTHRIAREEGRGFVIGLPQRVVIAGLGVFAEGVDVFPEVFCSGLRVLFIQVIGDLPDGGRRRFGDGERLIELYDGLVDPVVAGQQFAVGQVVAGDIFVLPDRHPEELVGNF